MKRCPQCEFIYEDDQSCCDMDGIDLVFDHASSPVAQAKTSQSGKRKTSRRSLLSLCAVVFGVLVLAIGYASLEHAMTVSSEPASLATTSSSEPESQDTNTPRQVEPAQVEPAKEKPTASPEGDKSSGVEPGSRSAVSPKAVEPLHQNSTGTRGVVLGSIPPQNRVEPSRSQPTVIKVKPAPQPAKKDSKVVSIVKKTGRMLTKPFKL
ncbi:MAG TPA: hypothetical protein VFR80_08040 [Pyrinomonadaceae bacterium]|nr:hypothetical protein [Pyrinomonadaceae bacterium]